MLSFDLFQSRIGVLLQMRIAVRGTEYSAAASIKSAVVARLMGNTSMMFKNVLSLGNTQRSQLRRTPQMPSIVKMAGGSEISKPRR